ncbi:MAG TPA: hypothetical protein ACFYD3_03015 [Candidatus Hypogeohydataceae bacterium YC41]
MNNFKNISETVLHHGQKDNTKRIDKQEKISDGLTVKVNRHLTSTTRGDVQIRLR